MYYSVNISENVDMFWIFIVIAELFKIIYWPVKNLDACACVLISNIELRIIGWEYSLQVIIFLH